MQGSKQQEEEGTLVLLAAGDRSLFDDCQSCFQAVGKNSFYLGNHRNKPLRCRLTMSFASSTDPYCALQCSFPRNLGLVDVVRRV